ncbi:MAG: ABC transporter ATP-binding protein [Deltaproteobacteria bacterium]|nr:ABC transporter ATP-binding protein [Deltaproteobacteria bacterium]
MLNVKNLSVSYDYLQVVWDVSFQVDEGHVVAILGPNGAGKSTTLKCIAGILPAKGGVIEFMGQNITNMPTHYLPKLGLTFIPEERNLFPAMTVYDNLMMGAYILKDKKQITRNLDYVFSLFPRLAERRSQYAGTMSGGERQMLAVARGLMSNPRMVILDEPSIGLSPENVLIVFETIDKLKSEKVTVLIVEQNVDTTLKYSDEAYVIERGRIVLYDASHKLLNNDYVKRMYLGLDAVA